VKKISLPGEPRDLRWRHPEAIRYG